MPSCEALAPTDGLRVALAHDYLTQRGGAERVALLMAQAFPDAPLHTTLYEPATTFPEFAAVDVRPSVLNRVRVLRRDHRLALPLLAPTVAAMRIDADVLLASSSGWAHGMRTTGRKIVYCHAPARWLYQTSRYLGSAPSGVRSRLAASAIRVLGGPLRRWDRRAASSADTYVVNSTVVQDAVRQAYGIDAEVLPPPPALPVDGVSTPVPGVEPGFLLCVARLLPYKNVDVVIDAARTVGRPLVVVGDGPERARLQALAGDRARLLGVVDDAYLRWLYRECTALVAASYEDYGLSPLEAAAFGKPTVALRAGGYLDTIREGETGLFFDRPVAADVAAALVGLDMTWGAEGLRKQAEAFSADRFRTRLTELITGA